jgi:hypothetical protein
MRQRQNSGRLGAPRAPDPREPAKRKFDGAAFGREVAAIVKPYAESHRASLRRQGDAKLAAIERRLDDMERKGVRYAARGVWRAGESRGVGVGVPHKGSLWIAQRDNTNSAPGSGSQWRLAVKRGGDGT